MWGMCARSEVLGELTRARGLVDAFPDHGFWHGDARGGVSGLPPGVSEEMLTVLFQVNFLFGACDHPVVVWGRDRNPWLLRVLPEGDPEWGRLLRVVRAGVLGWEAVGVL